MTVLPPDDIPLDHETGLHVEVVVVIDEEPVEDAF